MAVTIPVMAVRGSPGLYMSHGPPHYDPVSEFVRDESRSCKAMVFSSDGRYFAWANGLLVRVVSTSTWKVVMSLERPKVACITFSPKGKYFLTWEPYTVTATKPEGSPNLNVWEVESGNLVRSFIQKKQIGWQPQWTHDEVVCARLVGSEILFYESGDFEKTTHKVHVPKVSEFSFSPGPSPYHVLCYVPGEKAQPSFGRLFQYPKLEHNNALANKSFFQADRVEMKWNRKGTGVLLMTSVDVDKSGSSYYGKQALHFLSIKGETAMVVLAKEGPIYSVEWSPKSNEFCVIYGFMPAKTTIFNLKCEVVFDFGTGPRNAAYYNPFGNLLILGGFGNLSGNLEVWEMDNHKLVRQFEAPDTTHLCWSPDGEHFLTATTAPRLREANGFKIWHYTGALLYERPWNKQEELWEVLWQNFPEGVFPPVKVIYKPVEGIQASQPQASKAVYRPPGARGKESTFKLREYEPPSNQKSQSDANVSKAALKQKKKREARKAKKEQETSTVVNGETTSPAQVTKTDQQPANEADASGDREKDKKVKNIKKKLEQIQKLKDLQSSGKQLELNQLGKIGKESELLKELEDLML